MAGHLNQTKHIRLVAFLVLVCLTAGLVRRAALSSSSSSRSDSTRRELVESDRIHGRWEPVRASLGLPALSHDTRPRAALAGRVDNRASRFDLGRKRRAAEAARPLSRLHFALDARLPRPDDAYTVTLRNDGETI